MFPVDVRAESGEEVPKRNCGLAIEDWMEHIEDLVSKRVGGCRTFWRGSQNWGSESYPCKLVFFFGSRQLYLGWRVAQS
jgi:hypothetical protein